MKFKLNADTFRRLKSLFHLYFIQINFENGDKNGVFCLVVYLHSFFYTINFCFWSFFNRVERAPSFRPHLSLIFFQLCEQINNR
jgi:hypothetical protein